MVLGQNIIYSHLQRLLFSWIEIGMMDWIITPEDVAEATGRDVEDVEQNWEEIADKSSESGN